MIYKIVFFRDIVSIKDIPSGVRTIIEQYVRTISAYYGENRNIDNDDGGYLLYLTPGTPMESVKEFFDYTSHPPEYLTLHQDVTPPLCAAHYVLNNEYTVTILLSPEDMPIEYLKELEGEAL